MKGSDSGENVKGIPAGLDSLLGLPKPAGFCGVGGRTARLRKRSDHTKELIQRPSCNGWGCPVCSARKRRDAGIHYGQRIRQANGSLVVFEVGAEDWDALRKRLTRKGASWVRVGCVGQPLVVVASVPPEFGGTALPDRDEAVRRLGRALRELVPVWEDDRPGRRARPIGSSKDWKQPERERKYERIEWVNTTRVEKVVEVLEDLRIPHKVAEKQGTRLWDVRYTVPPELRPELEARLSPFGVGKTDPECSQAETSEPAVVWRPELGDDEETWLEGEGAAGEGWQSPGPTIQELVLGVPVGPVKKEPGGHR